MKTILCPIDFTPKSERLIKYVSSLAKDRNCKIYLISTQPVHKKELVVAGVNKERSRLDEIQDYLTETQGIPCGIVDEPITGNLSKKLGNVADHYDIMSIMIDVSPSNEKPSDMNLKKMIQDALAPMMVIPDRFTYQPIKRLLYAYDHQHEEEPPLMELKWLSEWFDAELVFVTLLPGDTSIKEENKLDSIRMAIKNSWHGSNPIYFETIVYPNLPRGFENFLGLSNLNDLLVLSINHQNIMERIWQKRVVKGVFQYSQHPYLIIHA